MRTGKRVWRVITGFSGLAMLACQTPSAPDPITFEPAGYRVFTPGALIGSFPPAPLDLEADLVIEGAFGMAVSDSAVFVLDVMGGVVFHLGLDGTHVATIGRRGEGPGEFSSPVSIDVDRDGNVWVSDPQLSRLSKFRPDGATIEDIQTPYPVVNFMPLSDGSVLIPTMEPATLVATLDGSAAAKTLVMDPQLAPTVFSGGPIDRLALGAFRLAPLGADTLLVFRNKHSGDFAAWTLVLAMDVGEVESVVPLPLPGWLHTMMAQATDDYLGMVARDFAEEHQLVAFRSIRTIDGTIWLSPNAGDQVMLTSVPSSPTDSVSVVVPIEGDAAEIIDAAVVGDRLITLGTTEVRFYELDRAEPGRFRPPR